MEGRVPFGARLYAQAHWIVLAVFAVLPLLDTVLPEQWRVAALMRPIFIFALLGLGLNIVTGYTGLLHLGVAAFMAIGAYGYGILTCEIYPFQLGFWTAILIVPVLGAIGGVVLGLPTLRLRGDYLAIVTLGFGEIMQDVLRNLDVITKGTQSINPLPNPTLPGYTFTAEAYLGWYYLLLAFVAVVVLLNYNLERSRVGRAWVAIREDELAATCMGIDPMRTKLLSFAVGAAVCALAGGLWACYLDSTSEPGNYDFQISALALCMVIVGGMGNIAGVLLGALLMAGFNSILLVKLTAMLPASDESARTVFASPSNWKYMVFGLALILTMRFRPQGLLPSRQVAAEIHHTEDEGKDSGGLT